MIWRRDMMDRLTARRGNLTFEIEQFPGSEDVKLEAFASYSVQIAGSVYPSIAAAMQAAEQFNINAYEDARGHA